MREDWTEILFKKAVNKLSTSKLKLKQKEYLEEGEIPVVDQGKELIGGFTNDTNRIVDCKLPAIVFGDHTKCVKFINFPFAPGADGTKVLEPLSFIEPKYLYYYASVLVHKIKDKGYARHYQFIEEENLPIASLPEQRAIVSKIEELFSSLDSGIADLKKAQDQLKLYRQAVLKRAFEGELTKEWRKRQKDLPTGNELMESVREEREKFYKDQIKDWKKENAEWVKNGETGKKPVKPKALKEFNLTQELIEELPQLPVSYSWIPLGNTFRDSPQNGLYKPATEYGEGTDIIRIDNFYEGVILQNIPFKKVKISEDEIEKYLIQNDQILINRVNSIEYLGKSGLVKNIDQPTVFESNIMKLTILNSKVLSKYIVYFLTSPIGIREIRRHAKHAVNQASINQTDVSLTPLPFCSIAEQEIVVKEIDRCLSACESIEKEISSNLKNLIALRHSILKKAFEGELLTNSEIEKCKQEADYEPASKLLKRIKAQPN